jgi:hypothetical protein
LAEQAVRLGGGLSHNVRKQVYHAFLVAGLRFVVYALEAFFFNLLRLVPKCQVLDHERNPVRNKVKMFCPVCLSNEGTVFHRFGTARSIPMADDKNSSIGIIVPPPPSPHQHPSTLLQYSIV